MLGVIGVVTQVIAASYGITDNTTSNYLQLNGAILQMVDSLQDLVRTYVTHSSHERSVYIIILYPYDNWVIDLYHRLSRMHRSRQLLDLLAFFISSLTEQQPDVVTMRRCSTVEDFEL